MAKRRLGDLADDYLRLVETGTGRSDVHSDVRNGGAIPGPLVTHHIVGSGASALAAVETRARELVDERRLDAVISLGAAVEGEARLVARELVRRAVDESSSSGSERKAREHTTTEGKIAESRPSENRRLVLLGAGETTVTVRGDGIGGRNQELALAVALEWETMRRSLAKSDSGSSARLDVDAPRFAFASLGTDGVDGPTSAAGALVVTETPRRMAEVGVDGWRELERNNSNGALGAVGCLVESGATGTNVGDLLVMAVDFADRIRP